MRTPDETTVWIGFDIGKTEHFADVLDEAGSPLFAVAVANDEAAIEALIARAESFGSRLWSSTSPARWPGSCSVSPARRGVPVAYVPGLVMRRAADLYPGESKTDPPRRVRAGRHRPHPAPPGALARCRQRRTPGAAARSQRLRHRPRRRRDAALQPPAGCAHHVSPGPGARTGPQAPQCGGTGPARPLPDTAGAGHGGSRPHRADDPEALAAPRDGAHRGRHRGPRRPDRGRTRLGRDGSGDR